MPRAWNNPAYRHALRRSQAPRPAVHEQELPLSFRWPQADIPAALSLADANSWNRR